MNYKTINSLVAWSTANQVFDERVNPNQLGQLLTEGSWSFSVKEAAYNSNLGNRPPVYDFSQATSQPLSYLDVISLASSLQARSLGESIHYLTKIIAKAVELTRLPLDRIMSLEEYDRAPKSL